MAAKGFFARHTIMSFLFYLVVFTLPRVVTCTYSWLAEKVFTSVLVKLSLKLKLRAFVLRDNIYTVVGLASTAGATLRVHTV